MRTGLDAGLGSLVALHHMETMMRKEKIEANGDQRFTPWQDGHEGNPLTSTPQ